MFKKAKLYSLLAIIVASTVVGLFRPGLTVNAQSSSMGDYISGTLTNDAKLTSYRYTLNACLDRFAEKKAAYYYKAGGNSSSDKDKENSYDFTRVLSAADIASGSWFNGHEYSISDTGDSINLNRIKLNGLDDKYSAGFILDSKDGILSCNDSNNVVASAKIALGYGSMPYVELACNLGFKRTDFKTEDFYVNDGEKNFTIHSEDDVNACISGSSNYFSLPKGSINYSFLVGGTSEGQSEQTDAQKYLLSRYALDKCGTFKGRVAGANADLVAKAEGEGYAKVKLIERNEDGTATVFEAYYSIRGEGSKDDSGGDDVGVYFDEGERNHCDGVTWDKRVNNATFVEAYRQWVEQFGTPEDSKQGTGVTSEGESGSTCRIDAIGWLVCPVLNFLALIADNAYEYMDGNLLKAQVVNLEDTDDNGLLRSWKTMRDLANIAFVIAFMVIVFSQITSIGLSNYGLKKLLPKLIVCAILVNLSFYVCAILVDVSNIAGSSLKSSLESFIPPIKDSGGTSFWQGGNTTRSWVVIIGAILAGARIDAAFQQLGGATAGQAFGEQISGVLLSIAVPVLLVVVIVVATVVIALVIRQALIILLIVVSPLAFVALLLPNTEEYFTRWRKLFTAMLMFYPIIAVVFGASKLASTIISNSEPDNIGTQLAGAAAAVIPLFIMPTLIKVSGGVLNRFTGIVNDPTKGPIDSVRRKARDTREQQKAVRGGRAIRSVGSFVGGGAMGGRNSRSKRVLTSLTGYARNQRSRGSKDMLSAIESGNEQTYLDSVAGQANRNAAKTAQGNLHNAELRAETVHLTSADGIRLETETKELEERKRLATLGAQTTAINTLAATQPALLGQLKDAENRNKQADDESATVATNNANVGIATAAMNANLTRQATDTDFESLTIAGADPNLKARVIDAENRKKRSEDTLAAAAAPLTTTADRTAAMVAEKQRKAAEDAEEAAAMTGPILTAAADMAKSAELNRQAAENNLAASAQGSNAARTNAALSETNKKAADDITAADTMNSLSSNPVGQAALGRAKDAESIRKKAEDDSTRISIDHSNATTAISARNAELQKQTTEKNREADILRGTDRALANTTQDAELNRKAEESRLSAASQGSTTARVNAADAALDEKISTGLAAADTAAGTSRALANDAKDAELIQSKAENDLSASAQGSRSARLANAQSEANKKAAENRAQKETTKDMSGSAEDRAMRKSELELKAAETGSDADWAGQTVDVAALRDLTREVQQNQGAAGVAQGVAARRFNKAVADGTAKGGIDLAAPLGVASGDPEVNKAVTAAKTEAGEKEVNREQQALREKLAAIDPDKRDAALTAAAGTTDLYELNAVYNEMAARGRDGLLHDQRGLHAVGTDQRTILEEAIQSHVSALGSKAPDQIKGAGPAFDNIKGDGLASLSSSATGRLMVYLSSLKTKAVTSGAGSTDEKKYNEVLSAFMSAVVDIQKSTDLQGRFGPDLGNKIIESTGSKGKANNIAGDLSDVLTVLNAYDGKIR